MHFIGMVEVGTVVSFEWWNTVFHSIYISIPGFVCWSWSTQLECVVGTSTRPNKSGNDVPVAFKIKNYVVLG